MYSNLTELYSLIFHQFIKVLESIRMSVLHKAGKFCLSQILLLIITQSLLNNMYGCKNPNLQDSISFYVY